ncbi:hypothetical protein BZA70DRAFT_280348 [Myxozyma melibiosi]|uniref:G-patch domain-containing protein n=1 Tax=Myxozyma melibiosi TaxID=54550 RepID=A0ABR1F330_9ASCO
MHKRKIILEKSSRKSVFDNPANSAKRSKPIKNIFDDDSISSPISDETNDHNEVTKENVISNSTRRLRFLPGMESNEVPVTDDITGDDTALPTETHSVELATTNTMDDSSSARSESSDDDYMKMVIEDTPKRDPHDMTYTEIMRKRQKSQELKSRVLPPDIVQREKLKQGLDTPLFAPTEQTRDSSDQSTPESNVGLSIMAKMGFVPGQALGKSSDSQTSIEPLRPNLKYDRHGIGMDSSLAEEFRKQVAEKQEAEEQEKESYAARISAEVSDKHVRTQVAAAQKICRELDIAADPQLESIFYEGAASNLNNLRVKDINILWRELVVAELEAKEEALLRKKMMERTVSAEEVATGSLDSTKPKETYEKLAADEDNEEEDDELEEFANLIPEDRLMRITNYMRETYYYCFWCGCRYEDGKDLDDNCPGVTEADHE